MTSRHNTTSAYEEFSKELDLRMKEVEARKSELGILREKYLTASSELKKDIQLLEDLNNCLEKRLRRLSKLTPKEMKPKSERVVLLEKKAIQWQEESIQDARAKCAQLYDRFRQYGEESLELIRVVRVLSREWQWDNIRFFTAA